MNGYKFSIFIGSALEPATGAWVFPGSNDTHESLLAEVAEKSPRWATLTQYDHETGTCGGDYLISDVDGDFRVETLADAFTIAGLFDDFDAIAVCALLKDESAETTRDILENGYGIYDNLEDWAEQYLADSCSLESLPENLRYYFDYEKYARDCELEGSVSTYPVEDGQVLVVFN